MRRLVLLALLCAAATPAAAATRAFPVGGFDRLRSDGAFEVRVHTGAAPSVRASGDADMLERITVATRGGELVLGLRQGSWLQRMRGRRTAPLVIDVAVPVLRAATLSGAGTVTVDRVAGRSFDASLTGTGTIRLPRVQVAAAALTLTGAGTIEAAGRTQRLAASSRGTGEIRAPRLLAQEATLALSGTGTIAAFAQRTATATLSGVGTITVDGHPRCTVARRGLGEVRCG